MIGFVISQYPFFFFTFYIYMCIIIYGMCIIKYEYTFHCTIWSCGKWPRWAETNRHIIDNYVFLRTTAYFVVFDFCDWAKKYKWVKKYKVICKDVNCNLRFERLRQWGWFQIFQRKGRTAIWRYVYWISRRAEAVTDDRYFL